VSAPNMETVLTWRGRTVVDRDGETIGTLKEIYLDESERPNWGSIHTGLFGLRQTFAPLGEARSEGDQLRLPYERDRVRDAPNIEPDVQLTVEEEQQLYRHYGLETAAGGGEPDVAAAVGSPSPPASEPTRPATAAGDDAPTQAGETGEDAMTRSEEEVRVGTRTRERGRVRLKKYVVTDYVETKVPVKREEVRLEHEPPVDPDAER
jgi:stress response protein YsnF